MFKQRKKWLRLFSLHRYAGLSAAFFAIVLSVTGILLNHTEALGLNHHTLSSSWLMRMYGISAPEVRQAYLLNNANNKQQWLVEYGDALFLNSHEPRINNLEPSLSTQKLDCATPLTGAVQTDELLIIGAPTQVCLFTHKGELVDQLKPEQGNLIKRLGKSKTGMIVLTTNGYLQLNPDITGFVSPQETPSGVEWAEPSSAPDSIISALKRQHKGEGLPLERIILDLHSGRIVGLAGVYFMDLIALLLIFLATSGFIMWARRTRRTNLRK